MQEFLFLYMTYFKWGFHFEKLIKIAISTLIVFQIVGCIIPTEKSEVEKVKTGIFSTYPTVKLEDFFYYLLEESIWEGIQDEGTFAFLSACQEL